MTVCTSPPPLVQPCVYCLGNITALLSLLSNSGKLSWLGTLALIPYFLKKSFGLSFCPSSFLFDFRTQSPGDLWLQDPLIASVPHNVNLVLEYNYTWFFLVSKLYLFFLCVRVKVVFQILIYSQLSILIFIVSTYKRVVNFVSIWHKGAEFSYIFALVMRNL